MDRVCRHVFVRGRVQGVAFRWTTRDRASELGLAGWVRNLDDGRVEVWVEGAAAAVSDLLVWLEHGPPAARVEGLDVREGEAEGLTDFGVRRGAR